MKTPDEIKKGQECCGNGSCLGCPYRLEPHCVTKKNDDVKAYIQWLESHVEQMENIIRLLGKEKDAAICDMVQIVHEVDDVACKWCKNAYFDEVKCKECRLHNERFEWQGVQPTNTKEER